jgi:hypothetical protein
MPSKRTRFHHFIDQGFSRSEAAKKAKVASRSTAKRWHEQHLLRTQTEFDKQFVTLTADLKTVWANHPELHSMFRDIEAGESLEEALIEIRDWKPAAPAPPKPSPEPVKPRCKVCGSDTRCNHVAAPLSPSHPPECPCYSCRPPAPEPETEQQKYQHRLAAAAEQATGDPFGRDLSDHEQIYAGQAWREYAEDRENKAALAYREELLEQALARSRAADAVSMVTGFPVRGRRR